MKQRIIGGIIIGIITIPCLIIGGIPFAVLSCIVGMLACLELINVNEETKKIPFFIKALSMLFSVLIGLSNYKETLYFGIDNIVVASSLIVLLILSLFFHNKKYGANEAFKLIFVTLFIGAVINFYIYIFNYDKYLFIWLILIAVFTDVFAYIGGRLIGKHKFTKISPNKTIEGCIVGTIFGTVAGTITYIIMYSAVSSPIWLIILVTCLFSIVGQLGDLFFSLVKRENNVKDYSHIIPGHGGICDRIDSLTFIVIVFIILSKFL